MVGSRIRAVGLALAAAVACAGCGLGSGAKPSPITVRVTQDFGAQAVRTVKVGSVSGSPSDLRLLERHFTVAAPGGSILAIDGRRARPGQASWFFYVNGIQATRSASLTDVHTGDQIWFDLHDGRATRSTPATSALTSPVGDFPQPFQSGHNGRRYPSEISCSPGLKSSCAAITREFTHDHIPLSPANPGYGANDVLSINVGTWHQLYAEVAAELLKYGPGTSGVYAHFDAGGRVLELENAAGRVVRRLGSDSGIIAATANSNDPAPTWLVTGTDRAGVMAAARALTPQALANHFALAVHGSTRYPLPSSGASG